MTSHVTYRVSRRAASVPVEPITEIETHGISTAQRISSAARDDTDALLAQSRRHDRQLLKDINTRLANQSLHAPPVGVVKRSTVTTTTGVRKPPLPPTGRSSSTLYSVSTAVPRRVTTSRYAADYDDDVDLLPPTPVTKSVIRASSVPPRLPVVAAAPVSTRTTSYVVSQVGPYVTSSKQLPPPPPPTNGPLTDGYWMIYPNGVSYESTAVENSSDLYGYLPTRVTSPPGQITPVADLAIRQAHRNLDRIDRELKYRNEPSNGPVITYNFPPKVGPVITHNFPPKSYIDISNADQLPIRRSFYYRTPSTNVTSPVSSIRVRHASLSPLRGSGGASYHRIVPSHRDVSPVRPSELISLVSSPLVTVPPPKRVVEHEIKTSVIPKLTTEVVEKTVFPSQAYRSRTEPPLILPSLYTVASSPAPYVSKTPKTLVKRHVDLDVAPIPQSSMNVKPKMSDARRKVRDVLCKVKNDPHYFD